VKVILEALFGLWEREPVVVPVASYAEARKIANAMAEAIMAFWEREHWTYEWVDDRHAFVHHCAFAPEDRVEITIVGDAAVTAARKRERCEA
jgi:hypothetical protein